MATPAPKQVHSLVLDSGPILKNEPSVSSLLSQAENLYTIPAVISEIRDATARARIETTLLPFLKIRTPTPASVKVISDFARRTGDLEVLSRPDIQVLALAYELECERNHGDWRLRSLPGQKRLNGAPPESLKNRDRAVDGSKDVDSKGESVKGINQNESTPLVEAESAEDAAPVASSTDEVTGEDSGAEQQQETTEHSAVAGEMSETLEEVLVVEDDDTLSGSDPDHDDDDDGWITPSNIKKYKAKEEGASAEPQQEQKVIQVATITTDFAMQNVLLRMNLNLLSTSLERIKQLKTWVLRCHACFDISKDMSRQFCKRCGKPTLLRTSCSTDKDGNFQVHLKKNKQWNSRGNVFSIPKPVAGSVSGKVVNGGGKGGWGQSLILAEDQKEYVKAMTEAKRKKERDLMDDDFLPGILSGARRDNGGKPKIGAGRNVNAASRKRH